MSVSRWPTLMGVAALLAIASGAEAQVAARGARIGYVYPAGGRQGTTFQVTLGGQFLDGAANVLVSGGGVQATVVEHVKPITPQQANKLREQLKELMGKRLAAQQDARKRAKKAGSKGSAKPEKASGWTAEDEQTLADLRKKLAAFVRRPLNPAIAETVTVRVAAAPDAVPGQRELRLQTSLGLTNPLVFEVGQLPEFREMEATPSPEPPARKKAKVDAGPRVDTTLSETAITLPAVANGQILPGDVDRFRFKARKGQRLVVAVSARQLIPYLPDAVPGWFQATLALYDSKGNELAYADDFRFSPDPVLYYEIPADGQYVVEIRDAIYRGREDFVYRIALGELPFVTSIFPLGGPAGDSSTVELAGWNLPAKELTLGDKQQGPAVQTVSVRSRERVSNRVPFALDTLPECLEKEPNDRPGEAQQVALPVIVNGRIDRPEDLDVFRFEGRAGSRVVAEVYARRLNSPLDSVLRLTDAAGRQLAANDDHEDKGTGLVTHHADSRLSATLPVDGTYYLQLGDVQCKGGPEYGYRLRISPPQPDFELRVVPSSINARAGATVPITVYALRKDEFAGDVTLVLKDAPEGFALGGAWVPGGQDRVRVTLTVPSTPGEEPATLRLEGRATIQGREVSRPVVPAEDMMQAFAYRHLVPAQELKVAVAGRSWARASLRILGETPVKIPAGSTAQVRFDAPPRALAGQLRFELSEPPDGIAIKEVVSSGGGTQLVLQADAAKVKPGLKGNLIVNVLASGTGAFAKAKAKPKANPRPLPVATLPAIPFEIVGP